MNHTIYEQLKLGLEKSLFMFNCLRKQTKFKP